MKGFVYLSGVSTLALDRDRCTGCGLCVATCPHLIFTLQQGRAVILDRDRCMECGACALNCPVKAITVDSGVGCASGMINQWLSGFNIGRKVGGGCC